MPSKTLLLAACALGALLGTAAVQAQDKPVNLKLATWVPAQHALNPALVAWAESMKKASGGTISATLFPSEQLGKASDHYDMARDGIADFAYVNPGDPPGRFPVIAGAALPFVFSNAKSGSAAVDAWYRPYAAREMKDVKYCFAFIHDPGTLHGRKKLLSPADVKGLKVRPATRTIGQMVTLLGGSNVQASAPELRDMLERGDADAVTFPWGSLTLLGIDKVATFHLDAPLYATPFVWVMNKARFEALAPAQKQVVDDHCTPEWAEKVGSAWADFEVAGRARLAALPGHEVYKLTPEQADAWRKAIAPLEAQWAEAATRAGVDATAALESLKANVAKYNAAL